MNEQEKVIFRIDNEGVFAVFLEVPANHAGIKCQSTRGPVEYREVAKASKRAEFAEYETLAHELESQGHNLQVVARETPAMIEVRKAGVDFGLQGILGQEVTYGAA